MNGVFLRSRWTWLCVLIICVGTACYAWLERRWIEAHYHAYRAAQLRDPELREPHLHAIGTGGPMAWHALVRRLTSAQAGTRDGAVEATCALVGSHLTTTQASEFGRLLVNEHATMSTVGQAAVLRVMHGMLMTCTPDTLDHWVKVTGKALMETKPNVEVMQIQLEVALALAQHADPIDTDWLPQWKALAESGLKDERPPVLVAAIRLAAVPGVNALEAVRPHLGHRAKEVRGMALAALGSREELVPTDDLLGLLHDEDQEVAAICEQSLRSRGLTPDQLNLARQMTDPRAGVRAGVAAQVFEHAELDLQLWVNRLSRDKSPAVRASAIRAAANDDERRFAQRLHQMALEDPSPTVRQIAEYYLQNRHNRMD